MELGDAIRLLKKDRAFAVFREKVLEMRVAEAKAEVLKPCKDMADVFQSERVKGAGLALAGLLTLLDTNVPEPRKEQSDDAL